MDLQNFTYLSCICSGQSKYTQWFTWAVKTVKLEYLTINFSFCILNATYFLLYTFASVPTQISKKTKQHKELHSHFYTSSLLSMKPPCIHCLRG